MGCPRAQRWSIPHLLVDNRKNRGFPGAISSASSPRTPRAELAAMMRGFGQPRRPQQPMRFSPQFLDELRDRLPVSEVVGRRVALKKAGREFKGLSPFNKEKTPSFFVNDQKQAWFDFSSGKNGSIFDFVMLTEGVPFPEAVERLAAMAGMPLPKVSGGRGGARRKAQDPARRHGAGGEVLRGDACRARRRQGARLSRRPRARACDATEVPHRLCAGRALCAERASGRAGRAGRPTWWRPAS